LKHGVGIIISRVTQGVGIIMIGNNGMVSGTVRTLYVIVPVPSMKMILKDTIKILNNENDFILVQMPISIYVYIIYYNIIYIYTYIYNMLSANCTIQKES
jgi:hypothetical protein